MFKRKRGINLSYEEQGLVFFVCKNYKKLPNEVKAKIVMLCKYVAGEDWKPLFLLLTTKGRDIEQLASEYYISDKRLTKYRKAFYESFEKFMQGTEVKVKMSGN